MGKVIRWKSGRRAAGLLFAVFLAVSPSILRAQDSSESKSTFDVYGHVMLDAGYRRGPDRSGLVRRDAADEAPGFRE